MKRFNTYDLCTQKQTKMHFIKGSNCNTTHLVPEYLSEELAHALMDYVYGRKFLPREHYQCRSKRAVKNYKHAFELQSLGILRIEGTELKIYRGFISLIKKLKKEGWYYWVGSDLQYLEQCELSGRILEENTNE